MGLIILLFLASSGNLHSPDNSRFQIDIWQQLKPKHYSYVITITSLEEISSKLRGTKRVRVCMFVHGHGQLRLLDLRCVYQNKLSCIIERMCILFLYTLIFRTKSVQDSLETRLTYLTILTHIIICKCLVTNLDIFLRLGLLLL